MSINGKHKTAVAEEYMNDEESGEDEGDRTAESDGVAEGEEIIE